MGKTIDLRIVKTKKAIRGAFLELMNENGFAKISVKNIIDRALINRSTFYAHYLDKFDLLDEIEKELLDSMEDIAGNIPLNLIKSGKINPYIRDMVSFLRNNGNIFTLLISDKGDPAFSNKFSDRVKSIWNERNIIEQLAIPQNYTMTALIGMICNLLIEWTKCGFRESDEEFTDIASMLFGATLKNVFQ